MGRLIAVSSGLALSLVICCAAAADLETAPKPLDRIPAGTRFGHEPPAGWSNIVLFVEGRLASGDVDVVSSTVARYAKLFNLVMLANAKQDPAGKYYLDKVNIGFSMVIEGQNTIVTSDTHRKLGAGLGIVGGGVLSGNESALRDISQVARSPTSMIIDAPTIMLIQCDHREMICRYAIFVSPKTGAIGTTAWLLDDPGAQHGDYVVVEDVFQYLPPNMREDRVLNVKEDRFTFGIPAKDAFALVRIPQGTPFRFTNEMRASAGARRFTEERYHALWASMTDAIRQEPAVQTKRDG